MIFPKIEDIKMVKDLGGSTGAYLVKDSASNNLFVLKKGMHPKQAKEEYLANKIYSILNVDVPQTELYTTSNGEVFILHEYISNVAVANEVLTDDLIKQISKNYVADSLLANWDAYQNDNILVNLDDGKAYRIDNGGAMRYRARGGVKNSFNGSVSELQSLRLNNTNLTKFIDSDEIKRQITDVLKHKDEVINFIVEKELKDIMKARFLFLEGLLSEKKIMKKGGNLEFNPDGAIKDKIINLSGNNGGMLVGKRHSESGIKAINLSTGQPIEMEGGEVVITRNAVSDNKKRSFNGKMLTNRQILSSINESGGGVSFADGGDIPENLSFNSDALFEYGGETMCGKDLACYMAKNGKTEDDPCWDGYEQFGMKNKDGKEVPNCVPIMSKGGAVDLSDEIDALIGQIDVISFEDGGDIPEDENDVDTLSRIFGLPKSTGKGKNKIKLFKDKYQSKALIDASDNESILKIQFSTAKAQTFSDNVVDKFFNPKKDILRDENILSIGVKYSLYSVGEFKATTYSLQELIDFIENFMVESEGVTQDYALFYFEFNLSNGQIATFGNKGRKRKPTGRKKESQFGIKDIKKDFNNFLEVLTYGMMSYQKFNLVEFVLGNSKGAIDKLEQDKNDLEEQEKADAIAKKAIDSQKFLDSLTADETKLFNVDDWGGVVAEIYKTKTGKNYKKRIEQLESDSEDLMLLILSFNDVKDSVTRSTIIKEVQKIKKELDYLTIDFPTKFFLKTNNLLSAEGLLNYYFTQTTQNPTAKLSTPCNLPTPNGGKSNLPLSAYLNVRTPQFKSWFGDWEIAYETGNYTDCSKMINEETKEPKVFYHGVRKFSKSVGGIANMGQGVLRPFGAFTPTDYPASFFSDKEDYAKFYGGIAENQPLPNPSYKPFIYKLFLSIKKPLSLEPLGFESSYKDLIDFLLVAYGVRIEVNNSLLKRLNGDMNMVNPIWVYIRNDIALLEKIKDYGFDALIQIGDIPVFLTDGTIEPDRKKHSKEKEFLTFYPNQVKSVTVKQSFYLDFFDDIRFKKGGYVRI